MGGERIPGVSQAEWDELPSAVRAYIIALEEQVKALAGQIKKLTTRVGELEARLSKNSSNSHKPPSSDGPGKPPRTQSERERSGKKPGGQPGHGGNTLRVVKNPDSRVRHAVHECENCQKDISAQAVDSIQERQIADLPPLRLHWEAHEAEIKTCHGCGHCNKAKFPGLLTQEPSAAVIYGPNIRALCVYLGNYQLMPLDRTAEMAADLFGQRISTGSLLNWQQKTYMNLSTTDDRIKDGLANDPGSVHFDETGLQTEKKNSWLHVASNEKVTHFAFHEKRGAEAIEAIGILPRFKGTAIHDRWESYFAYHDCRHGLCGAHLLRDLRFILEHEKEAWAGGMRRLLLEMNTAVRKVKAKGQARFNGRKIRRWEKRYRRLLSNGFTLHERKNLEQGLVGDPKAKGRTKQRPGKNLLDALKQHETSVLLFAKDFTVPFTNNRGERDQRMSKVKMKVSGCFRLKDGARRFCRVRGYISTAKKQGWNILEALKSAVIGLPLQPAM